MRYEPGLLVLRLLDREGFRVEGQPQLTANRLCEIRVEVVTTDDETQVADWMTQWAPEAECVETGTL